MKKLYYSLSLSFLACVLAIGQESYTALHVADNDVPDIDGTIENIWAIVEMADVDKAPEHANILEPDPDEDDFSASWGMIWSDDGMYFILRLVDDDIVIEEDYYEDNEIEADKWWVDDNVNILFSKDLINESWEQFEFAWQPGVNQEEKLSSSLWANDALIEEDLVESAWHQDGDVWTLETFIDWEAFTDAEVEADMDIQFEVRVRDDDSDDANSNWTSMFHWSTEAYSVENDGVGMGVVTLSSTDIDLVGLYTNAFNNSNITLLPNNSSGLTNLQLDLSISSNIQVDVYNMNGQLTDQYNLGLYGQGNHTLPFNLTHLNNGVYFIKVLVGNSTQELKYIKQ